MTFEHARERQLMFPRNRLKFLQNRRVFNHSRVNLTVIVINKSSRLVSKQHRCLRLMISTQRQSIEFGVK